MSAHFIECPPLPLPLPSSNYLRHARFIDHRQATNEKAKHLLLLCSLPKKNSGKLSSLRKRTTNINLY